MLGGRYVVADAATGYWSKVCPSSWRPPAFGVRPPHCLRKKGKSERLQASRMSRAQLGPWAEPRGRFLLQRSPRRCRLGPGRLGQVVARRRGSELRSEPCGGRRPARPGAGLVSPTPPGWSLLGHRPLPFLPKPGRALQPARSLSRLHPRIRPVHGHHLLRMGCRWWNGRST